METAVLRKLPLLFVLFDLATDPGETNNLLAKHPERVQAMLERFEQIRRPERVR